jgi:predicted transcriptional regulator
MTQNNFRGWAIATNPTKPPNTELSITQQIALKIYALLSDGNYWKTSDIAIALNRKPRQIRNICQAIKKPWNIESSRLRTNGGYRIN